MQALIHALYPPQCVNCDALVASDFGLCADCWREAAFITGLACAKCGAPLQGDAMADAGALCDDCLQVARPWSRGAAAMLYGGVARQMVLALKHGDRMDLARPGGAWLHRALRDLLLPDMVVLPVPLHWWRMLRRKYNQSALLSAVLAREAGLTHCPDGLIRQRSTGSQEGRDRDARFANLRGAFAVHPGRRHLISGRPVLLVDDVMTSGATFSAATEACLAAGAAQVRVAALCRVAKAG